MKEVLNQLKALDSMALETAGVGTVGFIGQVNTPNCIPLEDKLSGLTDSPDFLH